VEGKEAAPQSCYEENTKDEGEAVGRDLSLKIGWEIKGKGLLD